MKRAVFCIVPSLAVADSAVTKLKSSGFADNDISVLFPDQKGTHEFAHEKNTKMPEGASAGAGIGGVVGGTIGLLAGIGALAIPGLGPFIAAGPIMGALGGLAAGAGVGGLTGALVGLGIPEIEAKQYEGRLREGNILISVHTEDSAERDRAKGILEKSGGKDIGVTAEAKVPAASHTH